MQTSSVLISALQASLGTGQELTIPEIVVPTLDHLALPIAAFPNVAGQSLIGVQNSVHAFGTINQGNSAGATGFILATLDRGIYRLSGTLYGIFVGAGWANSSADPDGVRVLLTNPQGTQAAAIAFTGTKLDPAGLALRIDPIPFGPFTYQFLQPGWVLSFNTFHATGAAQTIGAQASVYIEKLI